jgi:hypothetical protein
MLYISANSQTHVLFINKKISLFLNTYIYVFRLNVWLHTVKDKKKSIYNFKIPHFLER